jgi:pseudaminic acid synthase
MKINDKEIGVGGAYIIAELSGNHNQSIDLAIETIKAVATTGADAIKLQTYTADTITLNVDKPGFMTDSDGLWAGQTLYSLYEKAYTPWDWHPELKKVAELNGLDFFSSPFDFTSVDFLESLDVPAYKIASFEINDIPLIDYAAKKKKPMIISTGIASEADIDLAINTCKKAGNEDIILLKCTSEYPAQLEDANLRAIPFLREKFNVPVGLSDHTLGHTVPMVAAALGASIIEKHVILDKSLGGVDSAFSLDIKQFREMVNSVRDVEKSLGKSEIFLTEKILKARESSRSLYVVKNVKKGEIVTSENLRSIRPGYGLHTMYYYELLGKTFTKNVEIGSPMKLEYAK